MTNWKKISYLLILAIFLQTQAFGQLFINEVSASNYSDFTDNYGEYEDWIEIYNAGGAAVDLNGYHFSDDILDPTKYQVSASVTVPAGGFRVVFASNRNTVAGNNIHTSFKINQTSQEYAVLADPSGNIIDAYWMDKRTQENHSRGRLVNGGPAWGIFTNPSPGATNTGGSSDYAITPVMDMAPGAYGTGIDVNITSPQANVTVRYTTNGAIPIATSPIAAGPINVATTTVLHARAFSNDPSILPSFMETNSYFINEGHVVPIFSISGPNLLTLMNGTQISPEGHIEYFGEDGQQRDEARGDFNEHGNDSWAYPQRGIDYITRDQMGYNDEIHYPIFRTKDRPSYQRLILKAGANDNYPFSPPAGGGAHVIDAYVHSLSQIGDLRMDERSHEPCVLYVNGQYWGVYDVREKVDDLDFTDYYYDQGEGEVDFIKTWGGTWYEFDSGTANEWTPLVTFITTQDMTDPANYQYVKSVYNVGSLIDYFVLNSYVVTTDWLNWNTGWWRGKDPNGDKKKWRYILWDNDASFGQYINFTGIPDITPQADPCNPENIGNPGGQGHVPILNALLNNDEFYNDYVSRFVDLSQSVFSCDYMQHHLDSLTGLIEPEMQKQVDRWGGSVADWQNNVQVIRDFIDDRCAALNDGLIDCYDVDGPYPLYIEVQPPGAGWVQFNTLELTEFPWEGFYFGNLDVEMEANAYGINVFSHWELNNHVLTDYLVDTAAFTFTQQDTIVAWFVSDTWDVVLDAEPDGAGSVKLGSTVYANLPTTVTVPENVPQDLVAIPSGNFWEFDHWETENNILTDFNNDTTIFRADTTDFVVAFFNELENYNVTFNVDPPGGGFISFEGAPQYNLPYNTGQLLANEDYLIDATASSHFTFVGWSAGNVLLSPEEVAANGFTLSQDDIITAHFVEDENYTLTLWVEAPGTGKISLNDTLITVYPKTRKFYAPNLFMKLEAEPNEFYDLINWELRNHIPNPDNKNELIQFTLATNDTVVANFMQEQFGFYMPTAFSPNGDGVNDLYQVQGNAVDRRFYSLEIFDRWGNIAFSSTDITDSWNGSATEGGEYFAPNGVYTYRLKVRSVFDSAIEEAYGTIMLIR
ncbi:MAG: CotH kinase family protein [Bacteroidetes bacterium]|nr:CotH kinase family protein [Bacteroidota bacterium]